MNESDFRKHWLRDGTPFDVFEAKDLRCSVWGYYKAVLLTDNCIQAFENLSRRSLLGMGRRSYEENKRFLVGVRDMLCDPDIRFRVVRILLEGDGKDCARYQELIQDNDGQMLAGMLCSDEYSQVRGLEPDELLERFTVEDYLRGTQQTHLLPQYERIMSVAAGGSDHDAFRRLQSPECS